MQKAANFVRGWAEFQVTGESCEEYLNLCAREGLGVWRFKKLERTRWSCRVSFLDWPRAKALAGRSGCGIELIRRGGVPGLLWQLRYRWALLAGLVVCLALTALAGQFVLDVRVSGNHRVSTGAILTQLRAQGVRPGTFGPGVDIRQVSHAVMLELPELSWMTINLHGSVCEVLVREGTPRPELMEEDVPARIVAKYPGIVTHVDATRGQQLVEEGQTVAAGDTLIGSYVDFVEPEGYNGDMGGMTVRAGGRVRARTWHTLKASMPLTQQVKVPTGREKHRFSLEFFGRGVKFYAKGGIPYPKYDKIVTYHTPALPGGLTCPIAIREETCREYTLEEGPADPEEAQLTLQDELTRRLEALASEDEVLRVNWEMEESETCLTLTLLAECEQLIGLTVED